MSPDGRDAKRRQRLVQELIDEDVALIDDIVVREGATDDFGSLSPADAERLREVLLDELLYSRRPPVHERRIPSYGCVVFPMDLPDELPEGLQMLDRDGVDDARAARELCDGVRTFLVRQAAGSGAGVAVTAGDDELSLVRLAESSGAWIVQRQRDGAVRVFGREHVHLDQFDRWSRKPYGRTRWVQLAHATDADDQAVHVGGPLLDLSLHLLSPRGIGTTFIWYPRGTVSSQGQFAQSMRPLAVRLGVAEPLHGEPLASVLAAVDGACVVGPEGDVLGVEAFVRSSDLAMDVVRQHQNQGARHTSAARFSFDEPDAVVFVVSADGPVTVYSDGIDVLRLDQYGAYPAALASAFPDVAERVSDWSVHYRCERCDKPLVADFTAVDGNRESQEVLCPVCGSAVARVRCTFVEVRVTKPWARPGCTALWGLSSAAAVGCAVGDAR